jgi:hypothetical protein
MILYLNAPRMFWQIPETDISLTRSNPIREVTDDEIESLNEEQKAVIKTSLDMGTVAKVNKSFIPQVENTAEKILKLPVTEIHRRYVSACIMRKDVKQIDALLTLEGKKKKPRENLVAILKGAKGKIFEAEPELRLRGEIEEAEEEIEGVIVESKAPSTPRKRPPQPRRSRKTAGRA